MKLTEDAKNRLRNLREAFQRAIDRGDAPMSIDVVDMADLAVLMDEHIETNCILSEDMYQATLDKWLCEDERKTE